MFLRPSKTGVYYSGTGEIFPTTGDFVLIRFNQNGDSMIVKTLPRRSEFKRSDFSGHAAGFVKTILEKVVAANFDFVFILTSMNRDFNVNRVLRYLTQEVIREIKKRCTSRLPSATS